MHASHGEDFHGGNFQVGNFQAIQEYFQRRSCRFCSQPFSGDSVKLLRAEPGVVVVRVACLPCGRPLGIALVGMKPNHSEVPEPLNCNLSSAYGYAEAINRYPADWTKKDINRLSSLPVISYDDVLDAHHFIDELEGDWSKHLPRTGKQAVK